jgi:hypothetical protein
LFGFALACDWKGSMATGHYRLETKIIGRRVKGVDKSVSVVAKAAYRSGQSLHDDRADKTFNYRPRTQEVVYSEIMSPANAPNAGRRRDDIGFPGIERTRSFAARLLYRAGVGMVDGRINGVAGSDAGANENRSQGQNRKLTKRGGCRIVGGVGKGPSFRTGSQKGCFTTKRNGMKTFLICVCDLRFLIGQADCFTRSREEREEANVG